MKVDLTAIRWLQSEEKGTDEDAMEILDQALFTTRREGLVEVS